MPSGCKLELISMHAAHFAPKSWANTFLNINYHWLTLKLPANVLALARAPLCLHIFMLENCKMLQNPV
jgi:hypothetical protein